MTELTPVGKEDPLDKPAVCVVETPEQLSVPVGVVKLTTAVHWPGAVVAFMFVGHVTEGAWASTTVTENAQVEVLPRPSVTRKVLLVVPTGKLAPLARPTVWVVVADPPPL